MPNATVSDAVALYVLDTVTQPAPTVDTLRPLRFTWTKNAASGNANGAGNLTCAQPEPLLAQAAIGVYLPCSNAEACGGAPAPWPLQFTSAVSLLHLPYGTKPAAW